VQEWVLTRAAVRELDRRAVEEYGLPSLLLMENAGREAARVAQTMLVGRSGPVLVLCGPGNNGGDGLVIARTLLNRGVRVRVGFVGSRAKLDAGAGDFGRNLALWRALDPSIDVIDDVRWAAELPGAASGCALIVDAMFGTGLDRELASPWREVVAALNARVENGPPVLAVDLPSGLDADTGAELGAAERADVTVTFVANKPGLMRVRGPALAGKVHVVEIGIPRPWVEAAARQRGEPDAL
jgi:NAD(P)H-hydrate epimerase